MNINSIKVELRNIRTFQGRLSPIKYIAHMLISTLFLVFSFRAIPEELDMGLVDKLPYLLVLMVYIPYNLSCLIRRVRDIGGGWIFWLLLIFGSIVNVILIGAEIIEVLPIMISLFYLVVLILPSDYFFYPLDSFEKPVFFLKSIVLTFSRKRCKDNYYKTKKKWIDLDVFNRLDFVIVLTIEIYFLFFVLKLYFYLHESSVNRVFPVLSLIVISIISLSVIAIFIHICIKRTRDIGWTKWSNLWLIVPYANIVFLLFLIFTPEGFSFGDFFREFGSSFIKIGMFVVVPLAVHLSKNADTVVKVGNDIPIAPVRPRAEVMDGSIAKVTEEFIKPVSDGYEILNVDASKMADQVYRDELIEQQGVLLIKSGDRSDALEYLNFSFQKPEILIAIPKTNYSVRNMYGKSLPSDLVNHITNQMRKLIPLSEQIETGLQSRWSEVKVNRIDEAIKSSNNDVIIIVGHMKDRKLLLPTGERLSISDLHQRAENNNKKILVIACNTFDGVEPDFSGLVSFDRLDYKPVMEAIKRAESVRCDAGCGTITTGSYIYSISESLALDVRLDKENRTKIKILLTISSGGVGVGVIISTEGINR